jgi:hypothetical protein
MPGFARQSGRHMPSLPCSSDEARGAARNIRTSERLLPALAPLMAASASLLALIVAPLTFLAAVALIDIKLAGA